MGGELSPEQRRLAALRVAEVAKTVGAELPSLGRALHAEIADSIPELRGDDVILELLRASTESNVETFLHVAQHDIHVDDVRPPPAAIEYAHRLAQRAISANALLRAYRIGQNRVLDWAVAEVAATERDRDVAFAASQAFRTTTFAYVDRIAEQVVAEYEAERERWLANRNTVRTAMLTTILTGRDHDLGTAESAIGYRLRQHHLGVVIWTSDEHGVPSELRRMESLVAAIGEAVDADGPALFLPQDRSLAWGWIPLGRSRDCHRIDRDAVTRLITDAGPGVGVAFGRPHSATVGFRRTHQEAQRAHVVASIAGDLLVTDFDDAGVQLCSLLARDLEATRDLVASTLGGLAADDENTALMRATLLAFLKAGSSYVAAAEVIHLHKNTVKYRVDKAIDARGRPLDDDRLNLEIALTACHWLGSAVLPRDRRQARA
ncbi:helix-turn-helix domain-containing protein [Gordonia sp. Z-3]|uniref:Helix-turn-helix domain-containing protein n=2 Tax=Gordonia TaxID=2053 RepID=A0A9X3D998_9ACTN|nr:MULTISPECIES: helix-turn-helix domain-containing protein [Gordonia]MCF3936771.1 helix-turn-helix domain-containing protein [Gordonia tangerina]MCX2965992.1 helix-turn-helix domain-containing protein [Gordonia aquimaris]MED5801025.1 helix-turn-helix domain-containing protein [Gordonia sp. Z-3]